MTVTRFEGCGAIDRHPEQAQIPIMPKRKEPELDPKEQFKRFVETAREHGLDESGKDLERVFKKIVPPKRKGKSA